MRPIPVGAEATNLNTRRPRIPVDDLIIDAGDRTASALTATFEARD